MVKVKKEKRDSEAPEDGEQAETQTWEEKTRYLCAIAKPLASKKLTKRLLKTIKKACKQKNYVRKGVREVQKYIRKKEEGIVVIAGDVSPIDVISHMPILCEEKGIPYCYTPSKEDLGAACGSKRQTCMVLIRCHEEYKETFDECVSGIKDLPQLY